MRFFGIKVGPFIFGETSENSPESPRTRLVVWLITIALITSASIPVGLLLAIPTALYLLITAAAAPTDTEDQP